MTCVWISDSIWLLETKIQNQIKLRMDDTTHWEETCAIIAPLIPNLQTKINIGSNAIFVRFPTTVINRSDKQSNNYQEISIILNLLSHKDH